MRRDTAQLKTQKFDVLVIGGGIYGAWTAYDAVLRGLSVALVDKSDWASGTSSASTKLIHGGLRYLEQFRFGLVRRALHERERLMRLAPHRVKGLRFVIPDYADNRVGRWKLRAGLMLYDVLAGGGSGSRVLDRQEVVSQHGFLVPDELQGGLAYNDCKMDDARFVVEIVDGAASCGAVVANYCKVVRLIRSGRRVTGAVVCDTTTGHEFEVHARTVVNTTGPWTGTTDDDGPKPRLVKGVHLVMPGLASNDAYLFMTGEDGRVFFLVPWYGRTLLGTTDTDFDGGADDVRVTRADIDYLLNEAARYVGGGLWREQNILGRFAGVRALQDLGTGKATDVTREWRVTEPDPGLFVSLGGKFTSARADATEIVDRVMNAVGRDAMVSPTETRAFPWAPPGSYDAWLHDAIKRGIDAGLDEECARVLAERQGAQVDALHLLIKADVSLAHRIVDDLPFVRAELVNAVTDEMAITLEDVVRRRVPLAILCELNEALLQRIAGVIAPHIGCTSEALAPQITTVLERWSRPITL